MAWSTHLVHPWYHSLCGMITIFSGRNAPTGTYPDLSCAACIARLVNLALAELKRRTGVKVKQTDYTSQQLYCRFWHSLISQPFQHGGVKPSDWNHCPISEAGSIYDSST